ncbi:MAG TPA: TetR/AcrR family transcriptional regulator [Mycobacterium sp.]
MARQVRAEATRRKILDAAVEVFDEVGYAGADRAAIIERTGMTKGAFYHHFDSMESLASALIDEGAKRVFEVMTAVSDSFSPALENMVHGSFLAAGVFASDKVVRTAEQLAIVFGKFNDTGARVYTKWVEAVAAEAKRAIAEGDLRDDLDPKKVSQSIISAAFGTRILSGNDLIARLTHMWELFLPAIVTDTSLAYYREYLAREALRHVKPDPPS